MARDVDDDNEYDLGAEIVITAAIEFVGSGTPSVTVEVLNPETSEEEALSPTEVTNELLGDTTTSTWEATITPDSPGRWEYRVTCTGVATAAKRESFYVRRKWAS